MTRNGNEWIIIELHKSKSKESKYEYRVRMERIGGSHVIEYMFANDSCQLYLMYKHLTRKYLDTKQYKHVHHRQLPPNNHNCASKKLRQLTFKSSIDKPIEDETLDLVEYLWFESIGNIQELFGPSDMNRLNLSMETVDILILMIYIHIYVDFGLFL